VLGNLDQIVGTWVKNVIENKGFNERMVEEAKAMSFPFAWLVSLGLGVNGLGANIDTLCVGPRHVTC